MASNDMQKRYIIFSIDKRAFLGDAQSTLNLVLEIAREYATYEANHLHKHHFVFLQSSAYNKMCGEIFWVVSALTTGNTYVMWSDDLPSNARLLTPKIRKQRH
jgi:hypothetical protein